MGGRGHIGGVIRVVMIRQCGCVGGCGCVMVGVVVS